jgi:hypothetical protein
MTRKAKAAKKDGRGRPQTVLTKEHLRIGARVFAAQGSVDLWSKLIAIPRRTLYDPAVKVQWEDLLERKRAETQLRVLERQMAGALKGHPVSQIWWGKQYLGQRDKHEHTGSEGGPLEVISGANERLLDVLDKLHTVRDQHRTEEHAPPAASAEKAPE